MEARVRGLQFKAMTEILFDRGTNVGVIKEAPQLSSSHVAGDLDGHVGGRMGMAEQSNADLFPEGPLGEGGEFSDKLDGQAGSGEEHEEVFFHETRITKHADEDFGVVFDIS